MGSVFINYLVLGLPSGEEGTKISEKEITKAYRTKALELHPDKRAHESNAVTDFQNLQVSYNILKDEVTRKVFDDELIRKKRRREYTTRSRMMSDVEERKGKRRMSDLDETWLGDMISKLNGIRMSDDEESKRRMMADLEEHEHRRTMSDDEEKTQRMMADYLNFKKRTVAYAFYPTAFDSP